ncbi:MAG: VWA domain-containing protein [Pseudorhodoplanes sp.]
MSKNPSKTSEVPVQPGQSPVSARPEIDAFLAKVRSMPSSVAPGQRGRLVFALDATMSRQPTWDAACRLQADMFQEAGSIGGLDVQLVYFRGLAECRASGWVAQPQKLASLMERIDCRGGHTQIGKVLTHAKRESEQKRVQAMVYVGDAMEEAIDDLCAKAGELGLLGVPVFMFQEGHDAIAEQAYREIARLTRGAYGRFAPGAAKELAELLRAAAAYAAGGMKALSDLSARRHGGAQKLLSQMSG